MIPIKYSRDLFLWSMSAIYLIAFSSLYIQIPGLYGDNGLLPARLMIDREANTWGDLLDGKPTLLKLTPKLGLDTQQGMDLLCLLGMAISFLCLVYKQLQDTVAFTLLWMFYLSLYQVGQTFLWFQWDILLLEAGFLTIIVAPFHLQLPFKKLQMSYYHQHDTITMWLIKWLLFRLMFASGVVKLTSLCPTWWGLTALTWHFESQCIPTPLAWWWHHLPVWFLKLGCVATYVIEIAIPFLFFSPVRSHRLLAFWSQILLQVLIILTGNYNFFNLLTIVLCISLIDDAFLWKYKYEKSSSGQMINRVASFLLYCYIGYQTCTLFTLNLDLDNYSVESKITFTEKDLEKFLQVTVPGSIWFGLASLGFEILVAIISCFQREKTWIWKNIAAVQCLFFGALAAGMFGISLIPYASIHKEAQKLVTPELFTLRSHLGDFHLTSSYGLFRRMTGVGGRPEVVIEGSNYMDRGWKEYEFLYKPGNITRRPSIIAPHQPRLDWQMWFAALGSYQHNPWFLHLVYRLFVNQPEVLQLMDRNPFHDKPPKFIRAKLYHYHFTDPNTGPGRDWWWREEKGEYLPAITKDQADFVKILKHYGFIDSKNEKKKSASESITSLLLTWLRNYIGQPEGFTFIMSLMVAALATHYLTRLFM
ncbi:hypothetical protein CHS0354_005041 [Potamilus streckersoni]|uniref:Lipase maturation factor n=1 Tax=Potamilus streckersoni TaxID=2493646 RepID=A0AAE0SH02_9BIVA|nr:hypothetical protein CHS0354_005041 [Potamilus streckersoni]